MLKRRWPLFVALVGSLAGCAEEDPWCVRNGGQGCSPCEPGFHLEGGVCVASPTLAIAPIAPIRADGASTATVQITGQTGGGAPLTGPVTVRLSRVGGGALAASQVTLDATGGATTYVACDSDVGTCLGPLYVQATLDALPRITAAAAIDLVVPTLAERCAGTSNKVYVKGESQALVSGRVITRSDPSSDRADATSVELESLGGTGDPRVVVRLGAAEGNNLVAGLYPDARRFAGPTNPQLDMSYGSSGCNEVFGAFEILDYAFDASGATRLVATFEHRCERATAPITRGCVRFQR